MPKVKSEKQYRIHNEVQKQGEYYDMKDTHKDCLSLDDTNLVFVYLQVSSSTRTLVNISLRIHSSLPA